MTMMEVEGDDHPRNLPPNPATPIGSDSNVQILVVKISLHESHLRQNRHTSIEQDHAIGKATLPSPDAIKPFRKITGITMIDWLPYDRIRTNL